MVSVTTIQLYHVSTKTARDNIELNGRGSILIKLYLQKRAVGWIWPTGHSLPVAHVCYTEFWTSQSQGSLHNSREIKPEKAARETVFPQMLCAELA